jgi:hypothetical protein
MAAPVQEKIKPSGVWYVLAVLLLVGGPIVGSILVGVAFFNAFDDLGDFPSVPIDGGGEVTLEAGDFTVYAEGNGVDSFTSFSSSDVEIVDPNGNPVDLSFTTSDTTYDINGREGVSVLTFDAPVDGTYQVNPSTDSVTADPQVTSLAIGPGFGDIFSEQVGLVVIGSIVGALGFLIGLILVILLAVKRGKAKRQRRLSAGGPPSAWGATGPYGQPGMPPPPGAGAPPPGVQGWSPPGSSPIS